MIILYKKDSEEDWYDNFDIACDSLILGLIVDEEIV